MAERAVAVAPPGQRGGNPTGMRDGRPDGALIVTHTPSRADLGKRLDIPTRGLVLGGSGSDFEVEGAQRSGSRLEVRWLGPATDGGREWRADAVGRVTIDRELLTRRMLDSGDDIRVVDTFFRFLCGSGSELSNRYHETIYELTIRDLPTGLANGRYLRDVLDREVSRALQYGKRLAVITLQFEPATRAAPAGGHDLLREVADEIRSGAPRDWIAGRGGELEVLIVAPEATRKELEHHACGWLRACSDVISARLGFAELSGAVQDTLALMASARANAVQLSG
jgi:GGDEF domain-containing protein